MKKRCQKCKHFLKEEWHHRMCRRCRKLVRATIKVVEKVEVYLGKKEQCYLCEEMDHLYSTTKFTKKVCLDCKNWLGKMQNL